MWRWGSVRWLTLSLVAMILMLTGCAAGTTAPAFAPGAATEAVSAPTPDGLAPGNGPPTRPADATVATPAGPTVTPTGEAPAARETLAPPPLFLQLIEPAEETVEVAENAASVTVVGRTLPTAVVSVNGELASPDASGVFTAEVALEDEMTLIEVVASDTSGAEERLERMVVR